MPGKKKRAKGAKPKSSPGKAKAAKSPLAGAKTANGKEKPAKKSQTDLTPLKAKAEEAKKELTRAENEAAALRAQAKSTEAAAKKAYVEAVAPYRDACRKAGVKCEFAGSRAQNVAPAVRFLVEKVKDGVKVAIKGKAKSEEVIPAAKLKESIGRAAFGYCERKLGPESQYGKKWAGLSNRLRAALKAK